MNDVDGLNDGSSARSFARLHNPLFARFQLDSSARVRQCDQTVKQRQHRAAVAGHGKVELRAANGAGSQRSAKLDRGRFFAAEKVSRSGGQIQHRRVVFFGRRLEFQSGQFIDAQHTFVREPEGGAAAQAGAQAIADLQQLIGTGCRP